MRRTIAVLLALVLGTAVPWSAPLRAQEPARAVTLQEQAQSQFRELTESMQSLQAVLAKSNPTESKLLAAGTLFVQEKKLHDSMARVKGLLEKDNWDEALKGMQQVRKDLQQLLELLQNRNLDLQKLLEQIAKLQGYRDEVDRLAKEQGEEKEDSARREALERQLEAIRKAKERTEKILAEQKEVRENTNQLGVQAAAEATKPLEQKEGQLKEDTDQLAKDLENIEKKAGELAAKPGEAKPGQPKPGEPKPGEPKAGSPSSGGSCSGSAKGASQSMQKAQQQLGDKKPESSLKDQDHAIEQLKSTLKDLEQMDEEARRELLKLPFEQLAKKQDDTKHATDTLAQKMEQGEEPGENGEPQQTPGRKSVQQAVPKQKAAAGQLKEYKPATQKQQDAKEDLEKAREELDEALAQLRQQLQDEVLRALEERFTAMLAKQRELTIQTRTLDKTRAQVLTASGDLPAALGERIQEVATGETDLAVEADDALKLLEADGTTAVFPEIVTELRLQLYEVAKLCRANQTDKVVQDKQVEVEDTLELLINALRRTIERREGG